MSPGSDLLDVLVTLPGDILPVLLQGAVYHNLIQVIYAIFLLRPQVCFEHMYIRSQFCFDPTLPLLLVGEHVNPEAIMYMFRIILTLPNRAPGHPLSKFNKYRTILWFCMGLLFRSEYLHLRMISQDLYAILPSDSALPPEMNALMSWVFSHNNQLPSDLLDYPEGTMIEIRRRIVQFFQGFDVTMDLLSISEGNGATSGCSPKFHNLVVDSNLNLLASLHYTQKRQFPKALRHLAMSSRLLGTLSGSDNVSIRSGRFNEVSNAFLILVSMQVQMARVDGQNWVHPIHTPILDSDLKHELHLLYEEARQYYIIVRVLFGPRSSVSNLFLLSLCELANLLVDQPNDLFPFLNFSFYLIDEFPPASVCMLRSLWLTLNLVANIYMSGDRFSLPGYLGNHLPTFPSEQRALWHENLPILPADPTHIHISIRQLFMNYKSIYISHSDFFSTKVEYEILSNCAKFCTRYQSITNGLLIPQEIQALHGPLNSTTRDAALQYLWSNLALLLSRGQLGIMRLIIVENINLLGNCDYRLRYGFYNMCHQLITTRPPINQEAVGELMELKAQLMRQHDDENAQLNAHPLLQIGIHNKDFVLLDHV